MKKHLGRKITITIAALAVFAYALFAFSAHRAVEKQMGLAHKEGVWTSAQDLLNRPKPPPAQNAAAIYQPLCQIFEKDSDKRRALASKALEPGGEADFEAAYRSSQPFLDEFAKGAQMPACQFQRPWQQGPALLLPEYAQLKNAFMLVCTQANLLNKKGQPAQALELMQRFAPMAGQTGTDPILISGLVQVAMDAIAFRTLQTILAAHGREPGIPEKAMAVIDSLGAPPDAAAEISGEAAQMMQAMNSSSNLDDFLGADNRKYGLLSRVPAIRDSWRASLLEVYRGYHSAMVANRGNPGATLAALRAIDSRRGSNPVLENLFPLNSSWFSQYAVDASRRNVMHTFIAGLEDWQKTGHVPTSLPGSGPTSIDVINGKSQNFAQIPGGFKVWGVDPNGIDHGGIVFNPKKDISALDTDVVYEYPWTPPVVEKTKSTPRPPSGPPKKASNH